MSELLKAVHEMARDLYKAGAMDEITMREIDASCRPEKKMTMHNPPHPGLILKDSLDYLGLSVSKAAKGLGVTRQQLHKVVTGRSSVSPEMALRLEKALGSTAETWLWLQIQYDLFHVCTKNIDIPRMQPKK